MGITGGQSALMYARARSAGGTGLYRAPRAGAIRSNYFGPNLCLSVNGTTRHTNFDRETWAVQERARGGQPGQLTIDVFGFTPAAGQEVIFGAGALTNRLFRGTIVRVHRRFTRLTQGRTIYRCTCLDWLYQLQGILVTKRYSNQSATAIALDLLSTYAPTGFTATTYIQTGLATIDELQFTLVPLAAAVEQLAERIGGHSYWDFDKQLHCYTTETTGVGPEAITTSNPHTKALDYDSDIEGVRNRILVEGLGASVRAPIAVGGTTIPVDDISAFATSGTNSAKLEAQILTYTGVASGGGGGLVGSGASPPGAPGLALASGAGIEAGAHDYAVTFVTAAGESIAGPLGAVTVGVVAAPASAPTAAADPTVGTGPDPGSHDYAVTFVTASGETTAGPSVTKATDLTAVPTAAPVPGTPTTGGSVDTGAHDYAVTFVSSIGETTPSAISAQATTGPTGVVTPPVTTATTVQNSGNGPSQFGPFEIGAWIYFVVTYLNANGETTASAQTAQLQAVQHSDESLGLFSQHMTLLNLPVSSDPSVTDKRIYAYGNYAGGGAGPRLAATISNAQTEYTVVGGGAAAPPSVNTATTNPVNTVPLTGIPTGASGQGVTSRKLYRRFNGAGTFKLLATIANNSATTYTDTTANASLGAVPPTTNTAYLQRIALAAIPTGGALVTSRKLYRTSAGGVQLKLLATIADNTTTTFTDTVTDASLGADVSVTNTATANQVALTVIPTGAAAVTSRKVYRTVTAGAQLKLLTTLADNTTTTYADSTADASLGANVPTTDTSGLAQPTGQVLPGATSMPVSSIGAFPSSGWAVIGNGQQVIQYTSLVANVLTGIPASGAGAITAAVAYNSSVTISPHLTGIPASGAGAIAQTLKVGESINLLVITENVNSQSTYGTRELAIQDRRLNLAGAAARGAAVLALLKEARTSGTCTSSDPKMRARRPLTITVSEWGLSVAVTVQSVTIRPEKHRPQPMADVQFASRSLEDLFVTLREIKERALIR